MSVKGNQKLSPEELDYINKANKVTYARQAKLWLNAFWPDVDAATIPEQVWKFYQAYVATDLFLKGLTPPSPNNEGVDLDEHGFHVFLERNIEPMTVIAAREKLREADASFDGRVSLIEFLCWHFKFSINKFIKEAPKDPGNETANLTPAVKQAMAALQEVRNIIQKIEAEKNTLEDAAENETSQIKKMKAKNELAQLLAKDQTELNKALLTAEANLRKLGGSVNDVPPGSLWWMNRELEEMKKYKPKSKK